MIMNNTSTHIRGMEDLLEDVQNHKYIAAIFDIDGTLIDSMPIWEDLDADFLKTQGIELSEHEKQELNETMWSMTVDEGIRYLKKTYQLELSEEAIGKALSDVVEQFYTDEVPAKQDVAGLVEALHDAGIPMALATVGEPSYETAALKRLGLFDHFDAMCDCNSLGTTKNGGEPAAASEPAGESGPAESNAAVLVIEDVLHALQAAKQAGFTTVAVEDAASAKDKPRILEVSDFYIKKDQ